MQLTHDILKRLDELEEKYAVMGQDMLSYLDGLLYADYLTYWDYIHLDTLLSLQSPKTPFPDEYIFITYHQITELYFKLCLQALEQLAATEKLTATFFTRQVDRLNQYFSQLIHSFDIMVDGMDRQEFLKFRMSLLPSSGFQSAQFRFIEVMSTDLVNLVHHAKRDEVTIDSSFDELYPNMYWKSGAIHLVTGRKTLTLDQFEHKYNDQLRQLVRRMRHHNLRRLYYRLSEADQADPALREALRTYDHGVNVQWGLSHLRAAGRYLHQKPTVIKATGGTNWQKYLPPHRQRIAFFPELWETEEWENWGHLPATDEKREHA